MIESGQELLAVVSGWTERLPSPIANVLAESQAKVLWGERHGTWLLRITWSRDDLLRLAELGVTPAGALPLDTATNIHLSIRSAATTNERYVVATTYSRQRSVHRLTGESLTDQLLAAVRAADNYVVASLSSAYSTGIPGAALRGPGSSPLADQGDDLA